MGVNFLEQVVAEWYEYKGWTALPRLLGHSSITVTEKYCADFKPRYDADIEKLNIVQLEDLSARIAS